MQTSLMQCAVNDLTTDRLTPHPFNLCSNAGSTHTSIFQIQALDMTLSTCTQLLWSTMARPVLSGTCPVKPLYGLGHRAAAQFQRVWNLLIGEAIFMWSINSFSQILREFFAMRCHVEHPLASMRECESNTTKFNTPAPHSHLRPCNTNVSHETNVTLAGKTAYCAQFGHFRWCTHFCCQRFRHKWLRVELF